MAAKIWWQPEGASDVRTLALGRAFSSVQEGERIEEAVSEAVNGRRVRVVFTRTRTVTYTADLLTNYDKIRDIEALQSHLLHGGLCTVAEEGDRTLGTLTDGLPRRTSMDLAWMSNLFEAYGGAFTPAAGDVFCLQGPGPDLWYEEVEVASWTTGPTVTLSEPPLLRWDTYQPWCFLRNKGFWPSLRLQAGVASILSTNRRLSWTLSLPLEVPPMAYENVAADPVDFPIDDVDFGGIDDTVLQTGEGTPPVTGPWSGTTKGTFDPRNPGF